MENLKIKSIYHFNKNEIEYLTEKYQITKKEISEKTENTDNYNSKEIVKRTNKKAFIFAGLAVVLAAVSIIVISNYFHTHGECGENASYKLIGNTLYIEGTGTVDGDSKDSISHFVGLSNEIKNVIISDGITEIGYKAFRNCTSLENIIIASSVTEIEDYAFNNCTALKSITIPSSVTKIGAQAFNNCTALKSITLPSSVTKIGACTFYNCTSLESITIPSGVTEIGVYAFNNCKALKSVTIPSSVTKIDDSAFLHCDNLTVHGEAGSYAETYADEHNISFANTLKSTESTVSSSSNAEKSSSAYDGQTLENETTQSIDAQGECGENASFKLIGNTLYIDGTGALDAKTLEEGSNYNYTSLFRYLPNEIENVIIADGITEIGGNAFDSCKSLKNITIPDSVTGIGYCVFLNCEALESVTIPSSVTQIGNSAFFGCQALKSITIPDSVTKIGLATFEECTSLESITIPSSVTEVRPSAFSDCTSLKSITIPSSVTEIGIYAFNNCTALESITIPGSVTKIGNTAFWNCYNNVTIHGKAGSYAETYANEHNISFKSI